MKNLISLLFFCTISIHTHAQSALNWSILSDVTFIDYFDRNVNKWTVKASFSEEIKTLHQQEVEITGYVIPIDIRSSQYALSAFALSSCFFCGGAGPETVMGLKFKETPPRLSTDQVIKIRGILYLHQIPGMGFHYELKDVVLLEKY